MIDESPSTRSEPCPQRVPRDTTPRLGGLWVALVTPFRDGRCDIESLKRLCETICAAGVNGLLVAGTTGEGSLLSEEERQQVVRAAVEAAGDRVIAGVFGPSARAIVASTGRLREVGAQAVAVIPPPYVSLTDSEMRAHYTAVADASELPVVLYNYPGQTPSPISTDVALSLAGHPAIVATKQSRATLDEDFARLICTAPDALPVLVGNPLLMLPAATLGASGAMLALANIEAERLVALWRVVADGDWTTARSMMRDLLPVVLANRGKGPDFKQVLHERGLIRSPERRLPLGGAVAGAACATAGLG